MTTAITTTNGAIVPNEDQTEDRSVVPVGVRLDYDYLAGKVNEKTQDMYKRDLQAYLAFAAKAALNPLEPATLEEWRDVLVMKGYYLKDGTHRHYSPNAINRMLSSVRSVAKHSSKRLNGNARKQAAEWALLFKGVEGVKVSALRDNLKQDARTRITAEDMRRLCEAPDTNTPSGKMHRALLLTMATSGLRISEIVTLTMKQIEKRDRGYILHVVGKGRAESREAPLGKEAYAAIQTWLTARPVASGWVFTGFGGRGSRDPRTNHIHPVSAWELVKRYAKAVGLESVKPHDFRRFVGTTIAKKDPRQAQKVLGHADINTTFKHYVLDELEPGLTDGLF